MYPSPFFPFSSYKLVFLSLFICFCFLYVHFYHSLDSTYEGCHVISVFLWLTSLSIFISRSSHYCCRGRCFLWSAWFSRHTSSSFSTHLQELRANNADTYSCGAERIKADPGVWSKVTTDPGKEPSSLHHVARGLRLQDPLHSHSDYKNESPNPSLRPRVQVWRKSECETSEDDCLSLSEQDVLSSGRRIWKRPVPILSIDGTHSAFLLNWASLTVLLQ